MAWLSGRAATCSSRASSRIGSLSTCAPTSSSAPGTGSSWLTRRRRLASHKAPWLTAPSAVSVKPGASGSFTGSCQPAATAITLALNSARIKKCPRMTGPPSLAGGSLPRGRVDTDRLRQAVEASRASRAAVAWHDNRRNQTRHAVIYQSGVQLHQRSAGAYRGRTVGPVRWSADVDQRYSGPPDDRQRPTPLSPASPGAVRVQRPPARRQRDARAMSGDAPWYWPRLSRRHRRPPPPRRYSPTAPLAEVGGDFQQHRRPVLAACGGHHRQQFGEVFPRL